MVQLLGGGANFKIEMLSMILIQCYNTNNTLNTDKPQGGTSTQAGREKVDGQSDKGDWIGA